MTAIRLVSAFGLLLVASAAAQAGAPAAVESQSPKLELGVSEVDCAFRDGQARSAPGAVAAQARHGARSSSLTRYLKTPAPYDRLLPQPIDDRGVGYRLWF